MLIVAALLAVAAGPATATPPVRTALLERRAIAERASELRRLEAQLADRLRHRVAALERASATGPRSHADERRATIVGLVPRMLVLARQRLRWLDDWLRSRVHKLHNRYGQVQTWLDENGTFRACPVPGFTEIHDNFGVLVDLPGVPPHRHTGDDVEAPTGSPIVAPFDGYATTTTSELGGLEIRVLGDAGYVYNAHAAGAGQLGWVHVGTVVGYVGSTGDATQPHDHLEWHPGNGLAADPYDLLTAACVDAAP